MEDEYKEGRFVWEKELYLAHAALQLHIAM